MSFHKLLFSRNQRDFYFSWHRVKYGLDHFLDHFWTTFRIIFWTNFLDHFKGEEHTISIEGGVGWILWVLREGWETECYYPGRGERRTITTQGGVGGGCNSKHCWFNWFFDWIFAYLNFSAGPRRFFIFSSCESETATLALDFTFCRRKISASNSSHHSSTWGHTTRVLFTVKICIFEWSNEKINFSKTKVHFLNKTTPQ